MVFRVLVLLSGSGTLFQSLIDAQHAGRLSAEIVGVVSDNRDAYGLVRADAAGIPSVAFPLFPGIDRAVWDVKLTRIIDEFAPDLVVSAGFMKLLGRAFLAKYAGKAINSHPALLPAFPGAHAVRDALAAGVKVTGSTIFLIDEGVDTGQVIAQQPVRIEPGDTEESLHERIKVVERRMLVQCVNEWAIKMENQ